MDNGHRQLDKTARPAGYNSGVLGGTQIGNEMREKLQRFMVGRYGEDRLNRFLLVVALVCMVLSMLGVGFARTVALVLLILVYYRMFSRKIYQRAAENQKYLKYETKVRSWFQGKKREFAQRKDYRIFKCPNCKQKLRVPRGRGKIAISCRKCHTEFVRKT